MPRLLTSHLALRLIQIRTQITKNLICGGHNFLSYVMKKRLEYVIYFIVTHVSVVHGLFLVSAAQRFQQEHPHKQWYWVQSKHQLQF